MLSTAAPRCLVPTSAWKEMICCEGAFHFFPWVRSIQYRAPIERHGEASKASSSSSSAVPFPTSDGGAEEGPSKPVRIVDRGPSPTSVAQQPPAKQQRGSQIKQYPMARTLAGRPEGTRAKRPDGSSFSSSSSSSASAAQSLETLKGFKRTKHKNTPEKEKFAAKLVAVQSGVALNCEDFSAEVCSRSPTIRSARQSLDEVTTSNSFVLAVDDGQLLPQAQDDVPEDEGLFV